MFKMPKALYRHNWCKNTRDILYLSPVGALTRTWLILGKNTQVHWVLSDPTSGKRHQPTQAHRGTAGWGRCGRSPSGGVDHGFSGPVWMVGWGREVSDRRDNNCSEIVLILSLLLWRVHIFLFRNRSMQQQMHACIHCWNLKCIAL